MASLKKINCKEIFRNAYENRYTWKNDFNGYEGKCIFINDNIIHSGKFAVHKDFKTEIQRIEDENIVKSISSQLFEVTIHRVKRDFKTIHSNKKSVNYVLHFRFHGNPKIIKLLIFTTFSCFF